MADVENLLSGFVSPELLSRVAPDSSRALRNAEAVFDAAALFVDLRGFSQLADSLDRAMGRSGADALTRTLNGLFESAIATVLRHNGAIAELGGDSLLALWPQTPDQEFAVHAARACATDLLEWSATADAESLGVVLHCGLGSGTAVLALTDAGADVWELVTGGDVLDDTFQAFLLSDDNECRMGPRAREWVNAEKSSGRTPDSSHETWGNDPIPSTDPRMRSFVARSLRGRSLDGPWLPELRTASVLYLSFPTVRLRDLADVSFVRDAIRIAHAAAHDHGGQLLRCAEDDKGFSAMIVFGALSARGDASHCLDAALSLAEMQTGPEMRIGVATGAMFCGAVGNDDRRQFTVNGAAANRAARLAHTDEFRLLCDQSTYERNRTQVLFEPIGLLEIKGHASAEWTYVPTQRRVVDRLEEEFRSRFVGRRREMEHGVRALLHTLNQGASTLLIRGEPGIGKSRFIYELGLRAEEMQFRCPAMPGARVGGRRSWYSWKGLLDRSIVETLSGDLRRRYLEWLDGIERPGDGNLEAISNADETNLLLCDVVHELAIDRPLFLVLDDAQWMDASSWQLAQAIVERGIPIFLAICFRSDEAEDVESLAMIRRREDTRELTLGELEFNETLGLVASSQGASRVSQDLGRWIHEASQGHPLFSQELANSLHERGLLVRSRSVLSCTDPQALATEEVPPRIEGVVAGRIDALSANAQRLLRSASILGRKFDLDRTVFLSDLERGTAERAFRELQLSRLVVSTGESAPSFRHEIIRDVAYQLVPISHRRTLHEQVANYLIEVEGDQRDELEVANHEEAAGLHSRAFRSLVGAAEASIYVGAHRNVEEILVRAFELPKGGKDDELDSVDIARAHRASAIAQAALGDLGGSMDQAIQALSMLGVRIPRSSTGWSVVALREGLRRLLGRNVGKRSKTDPRAAQVATEAARTLSSNSYFMSNPAAVMAASLMTWKFAEACDRLELAGRSRCVIGYGMAIARAKWLGEKILSVAAEEYERADQVAALRDVLGGRAMFEFTHANWSNVYLALDRVDALSARPDAPPDPVVDEFAITTRGLALFNEGRLESARRCFENLNETAVARGGDQQIAWSLYASAQCDIRMGECQRALELLDQALPILFELGDQMSLLNCEALFAVAHLESDDEERAQSRARDALARSRAVAVSNFGSLEGFAGASEVFGRLAEFGSPDMRTEYSRLAIAANRQLARYARTFIFARPRLLRSRAQIDRIQNRERLAEKRLMRALGEAERFGMRFEQASIHLALSRSNRLSSDVRRVHADASVRCATECGGSIH